MFVHLGTSQKSPGNTRGSGTDSCRSKDLLRYDRLNKEIISRIELKATIPKEGAYFSPTGETS